MRMRYSRSKVMSALHSLGFTEAEERHSYTALRNSQGRLVRVPIELNLDRTTVSEVAKQAGCTLLQLGIRVGSLESKS